MITYKTCSKCGERWDVSSLIKRNKKYLCPKCEKRIKFTTKTRNRERKEKHKFNYELIKQEDF